MHDNLDFDRVRIHAPPDTQPLRFGVQKPQQASHPQPSCCFRQGDSRNLDSNKYKENHKGRQVSSKKPIVKHSRPRHEIDRADVTKDYLLDINQNKRNHIKFKGMKTYVIYPLSLGEQ